MCDTSLIACYLDVCQDMLTEHFFLLLQVAMMQQWIQHHLHSARTSCDTQVNVLHNFLTDGFHPPAQNVEQLLQIEKMEVQTLEKQLTEEVGNNGASRFDR